MFLVVQAYFNDDLSFLKQALNPNYGSGNYGSGLRH